MQQLRLMRQQMLELKSMIEEKSTTSETVIKETIETETIVEHILENYTHIKEEHHIHEEHHESLLALERQLTRNYYNLTSIVGGLRLGLETVERHYAGVVVEMNKLEA